jgi:hypothetical protein
VEGFRDFKVFIRRIGPNGVGRLTANLRTSLDGIADTEFGDALPGGNFTVSTAIASPADYVYDIPEEPQMFLKRTVHNSSGSAQTISMFLYAVP